MTINLIIISRYTNTAYIQNVQSLLNDVNSSSTVIIPTDGLNEVSQVQGAISETGPNIIIYDWSTSLLSPGEINTFVGTLNQDLVYLGKFLDTCSKYSESSSSNNIALVTGTDPGGFNAIFMNSDFSGRFKQYLSDNEGKYYSLSYALLEMKISSSYNAYATSPNVFTYNPLYNSIDQSQSYSVKTTECEPLTSQIQPPSDNSLFIFWIILLIAVVCLVLFLLLNYTSFGTNTKKLSIIVPQK